MDLQLLLCFIGNEECVSENEMMNRFAHVEIASLWGSSLQGVFSCSIRE